MNNPKGKTNNPRGCPKGAHHEGRPTEDGRAFIRKRCEDENVLDFIFKTITGDDVDFVLSVAGSKLIDPKTKDPVKCPANMKVRSSLAIWAMEMGYGKAAQAVESESLKLGMSEIASAISQSRQERGLSD